MWVDRHTAILSTGSRCNASGYAQVKYQLERMGVEACLPDLYSYHIPKFYQLVPEGSLCRIQREGAASRPPFEGYVADCPGDTLVCRGYRGGKYSD